MGQAVSKEEALNYRKANLVQRTSWKLSSGAREQEQSRQAFTIFSTELKSSPSVHVRNKERNERDWLS